MKDIKYVSPKTITDKYDIKTQTLRLWAKQGKISFIQPNGFRRLYNVDDIQKILGIKEEVKRERILYARVSSSHQKEDLQRQISMLQQEYPNERVISDVGSGLNWKRRGFISLLELINDGSVEEIVVSYKDRLCRFGFELFEWICIKNDTKIVVLNKNTDNETDRTKELSEDLLAITTIFVARNNGLRASKYKQERKHKFE